MKSELLNYESNLEKKIVIQKSEPTCMKKAFRQEKSLFLGVKAEKQGSECPMIPTLGLKKTMIRNKLLVTLTLLLAAVLAGCDDDRFAIRLAPNSETCLESILSTTNELARPGGKLQPGLELEDIQALAMRPENLARAVGNKQYILHYYRRNKDFDEEVSPIKFPFYWEIDSTKLQTEGTYLVEIKSQSELHLAFYCEDCQSIAPEGTLKPGRAPKINNDFDSDTQARHCNEDACFSIRPRKLDLSKEVGKTYLVKLEAQQTYLDSAKTRIQVEKFGSTGNYLLRFRDQLLYRISTFVKELGIAMALSDKAQREKEILPRIDAIKGKIDTLRVKIQLPQGNPVTITPSDRAAWEQEIVALETERVQLQMEAVSVIPRLLVITPGMRCGGK